MNVEPKWKPLPMNINRKQGRNLTGRNEYIYILTDADASIWTAATGQFSISATKLFFVKPIISMFIHYIIIVHLSHSKNLAAKAIYWRSFYVNAFMRPCCQTSACVL